MTDAVFGSIHRRLKDVENRRPKLQDWQVPTLQNSWANVGAPYSVAGYWKDPHGNVFLRGRVSGGGIGFTILTLPVKYRPEYNLTYAVYNGAVIVIQTDGQVVCATGTAGQPVALDTIAFRAFA